MNSKVCVVLFIAMFGCAIAKPGYKSGYDVDYYVSFNVKYSTAKNQKLIINYNLRITQNMPSTME